MWQWLKSAARRIDWSATGLAGLLLALTATAHAPVSGLQIARERAFDAMLGAIPGPRSGPLADGKARPPVIVVDIDRQTLESIGPWPWQRNHLARMVNRIAEARPLAIGIDILIEGKDERSPAALARRLAETTGRHDLKELADTLTDSDVMLAAALTQVPVALGLALDPEPGSWNPPGPAILVRGVPDLSQLWFAEGATAPVEGLITAARGLGVLSLAGDSDARIRNVPLLAETSGVLRPGLALETVRLALGAGAYVLSAATETLAAGELAVPIASAGFLRLRPSDPGQHAARTISANDLWLKAESRDRLKGAIVLLGGSAPQLAGLRASASGELVPSVQLHADAVTQLLNRDWPLRPARAPMLEAGAMLLLGALMVLCVRRLGAISAALIGGACAILWVLLAVLALRRNLMLFDPLGVPIVTGLTMATAGVLATLEARRREALIRRRFEQHLAPEVVSRMAAQPGLLKLEGEMREISALFTDIEGFTAMTERADPRALVRVLDSYIEEASRIVVEHGGMVEKIVGDGLHAIFNAPLDLPEHPRRAFEAALALHAFSERIRRETEPAAIGLGRTRIGLETGMAIVGDVGGGRRLDYTAHGNAINLAARLEAANKELGTAICIGPIAASRIDPALLSPIGTLNVRGRSAPMPVFTARALAPRV